MRRRGASGGPRPCNRWLVFTATETAQQVAKPGTPTPLSGAPVLPTMLILAMAAMAIVVIILAPRGTGARRFVSGVILAAFTLDEFLQLAAVQPDAFAAGTDVNFNTGTFDGAQCAPTYGTNHEVSSHEQARISGDAGYDRADFLDEGRSDPRWLEDVEGQCARDIRDNDGMVICGNGQQFRRENR